MECHIHVINSFLRLNVLLKVERAAAFALAAQSDTNYWLVFDYIPVFIFIFNFYTFTPVNIFTITSVLMIISCVNLSLLVPFWYFLNIFWFGKRTF